MRANSGVLIGGLLAGHQITCVGEVYKYQHNKNPMLNTNQLNTAPLLDAGKIETYKFVPLFNGDATPGLEKTGVWVHESLGDKWFVELLQVYVDAKLYPKNPH